MNEEVRAHYFLPSSGNSRCVQVFCFISHAGGRNLLFLRCSGHRAVPLFGDLAILVQLIISVTSGPSHCFGEVDRMTGLIKNCIKYLAVGFEPRAKRR
jgi:hypothetical protein